MQRERQAHQWAVRETESEEQRQWFAPATKQIQHHCQKAKEPRQACQANNHTAWSLHLLLHQTIDFRYANATVENIQDYLVQVPSTHQATDIGGAASTQEEVQSIHVVLQDQ